MKTIKTFRLEAGISQEKLAELSGLSRPYINQLESGRSKRPSAESLYKIARALNREMEEFFPATLGD